MSLRAILLRVLIAWLLAMQPMIAGFQSAAAANAPALELCRGGTAPGADLPDRADLAHPDCCLACSGCALSLAKTALPAHLAPEFFTHKLPRPSELPLKQAGLGLQSARGPPV